MYLISKVSSFTAIVVIFILGYAMLKSAPFFSNYLMPTAFITANTVYTTEFIVEAWKSLGYLYLYFIK